LDENTSKNYSDDMKYYTESYIDPGNTVCRISMWILNIERDVTTYCNENTRGALCFIRILFTSNIYQQINNPIQLSNIIDTDQGIRNFIIPFNESVQILTGVGFYLNSINSADLLIADGNRSYNLYVEIYMRSSIDEYKTLLLDSILFNVIIHTWKNNSHRSGVFIDQKGQFLLILILVSAIGGVILLGCIASGAAYRNRQRIRRELAMQQNDLPKTAGVPTM